MKAYLITSRPVRVAQNIVPYQDTYVPEYYDDVVYSNVVIAETAGKAKTLFVKYYSNDDMEYSDIQSCRLLDKHSNREVGVIDGFDWPELIHTDPLGAKWITTWSAESQRDYWNWVKEVEDEQ